MAMDGELHAEPMSTRFLLIAACLNFHARPLAFHDFAMLCLPPGPGSTVPDRITTANRPLSPGRLQTVAMIPSWWPSAPIYRTFNTGLSVLINDLHRSRFLTQNCPDRGRQDGSSLGVHLSSKPTTRRQHRHINQNS